MDKRVVIASLVSGIVGAAAGGAVTYFTVKKTFEERAQKDIDDVKASYAERFEGKRLVNAYGNMPGPGTTPQPGTESSGVIQTPVGNTRAANLQAAQAFIERVGYATPVPKTVDSPPAVTVVEEQVVNVHERTPIDETKIGREVKHSVMVGYDRDARRESHKPYHISDDEFHNTETEWDKPTITYYEDDDTLVDEKEQVITDMDYMVGDIHLEFFGIDSGDKNIVYVRSPQISTDFEIVRRSTSYTFAVLGIPKGSEKGAVRRMREGDDD